MSTRIWLSWCLGAVFDQDGLLVLETGCSASPLDSIRCLIGALSIKYINVPRPACNIKGLPKWPMCLENGRYFQDECINWRARKHTSSCRWDIPEVPFLAPACGYQYLFNEEVSGEVSLRDPDSWKHGKLCTLDYQLRAYKDLHLQKDCVYCEQLLL